MTLDTKFGPFLLTLVFVAAAAAGGVWAGARFIQPHAYTHEDFHDRLFAKLKLSDAQRDSMEALERRHEEENQAIRSRLAEANRQLASLLESETAYNEDVDRAIEAYHLAMLEFQKASVRHLFEMREILEPTQRETFDHYVTETLREYAN
jgi:Spy/CpxP family protein refolding chaperone